MARAATVVAAPSPARYAKEQSEPGFSDAHFEAYSIEGNDEPHIAEDEEYVQQEGYHHALSAEEEQLDADDQQLQQRYGEEQCTHYHEGHIAQSFDDNDDPQLSGLSTVPSTPARQPAEGVNTALVPRKRLVDAGIAALKKNLVPGLMLQAVALLLILLYFCVPRVEAAFNQVARLKERSGYLFSAVSTLIFGGILPAIFVWIKKQYERHRLEKSIALAAGLNLDANSSIAPIAGAHHVAINDADAPLAALQLDVASHVASAPSPPAATMAASVDSTGAVTSPESSQGPSTLGLALFTCIYWAEKGIEVDAFYHLQSDIFGDDSRFSTIFAKSCVDMFVWNTFYAAPSIVLLFTWRDSGFQFATFGRLLRSRHFWTWQIPECLVSIWLVWIPTTAMIYLMPSSLQIPLFEIVLCFWSMVLALLTKK